MAFLLFEIQQKLNYLLHLLTTIACEIAGDHGSISDQSFGINILFCLFSLFIVDLKIDICLVIRMISHSSRLSATLSFETSNSKRMPLNGGPIFETLSRAQNSMYHLIC